jgi:hypothetical protein
VGAVAPPRAGVAAAAAAAALELELVDDMARSAARACAGWYGREARVLTAVVCGCEASFARCVWRTRGALRELVTWSLGGERPRQNLKRRRAPLHVPGSPARALCDCTCCAAPPAG